MDVALLEAKKAYNLGDVPVGAVIVRGDEIISVAHNEKELLGDSTKHAEMIAIQNASSALNSWRLVDCDMYVTMEPCPMCAGAIIQSRIRNLYFASIDIKGGAVISKLNILDADLNHTVNYKYIEVAEASELLKDFFRNLRKGG